MSYAQQLRDCAADARALVEGLDDTRLNWRPGPGRWSIAECLSHLAVTARAYRPRFEAAIGVGRRGNRAGTGPFPLGWFGGWFARQMEPPPKRRFRAPGGFAPRSTLPASETREAYFEANAALTALAEEADGLDLGRIRMRSPLSPLLRFRLGAGFAIVAAHERRHLWQARSVRDAPGFPSG